MELVYLWIEDYKNIKKQGFNFSPRFKCEFKDEYDENGKLKNNCELIIDKNEDYVSIFPENINITAIVGENGSGKSSLLHCINTHYVNDSKKILLFLNDKKLIVLHNFDKKLSASYVLENNSYLINSLIKDKDAVELVCKKNILHITNSIHEKIAFSSSVTSLSIYKNYNYDIQNIVSLLNNSNIKIPFKTPKCVYIDFLTDDTPFKLNDNISYYLEKYKILVNFIQKDLFFEDTLEYPYDKLEFYLITSYLHLNQDFGNTYFDIVWECNQQDPKNIKELIQIYYSSVSDDEIKQQITTVINQVKNNFELLNTFTLKIKLGNIPDNFISYYKTITSKSNQGIYENFNIFKFSFKEDLSDGEYQFLSIFSQINEYYTNKSILCIDEGDLFLHPNWQKQYIKYLVEFITNNFTNKSSFILTTHSPFILSDIPKENVIFLDKYKVEDIDVKNKIQEVGNCKNVSDLINIKQTFGANIHTLLSNGFFMKDGLMGEFAKDKIKEIFDYLKDDVPLKTIQKKQVNPIIGMIGEDFLKQKLLSMFKTKFPTKSKDEEIQKLKEEIERLKNAQN